MFFMVNFFFFFVSAKWVLASGYHANQICRSNARIKIGHPLSFKVKVAARWTGTCRFFYL